MRDPDRSHAGALVPSLSDQSDEGVPVPPDRSVSHVMRRVVVQMKQRRSGSAGPPATPHRSLRVTSRPDGGKDPATVSQPAAQRMAGRCHGDRPRGQLHRLLPHRDGGLPGSEPAHLVPSPGASGQPVPGHRGDSRPDGDHRHPLAVGQALGRLSQPVLIPAGPWRRPCARASEPDPAGRRRPLRAGDRCGQHHLLVQPDALQLHHRPLLRGLDRHRRSDRPHRSEVDTHP